ncbi:MAG: 1-phosphofructokinase family hexose kinase [Bacteroidetes bacterium]|nr:1-phosphofructokinase family hexose kinase [Bacteroidota bacterium]
MHSIITITFNPCIDVYTSVPALKPQTKLRCTGPVYHPGGGGINVARAITKLGGDALALFPCGGSAGKALRRMLDEEGVATEVVGINGETRQNLIVEDRATGQQYQLNMPGPELDGKSIDFLLRLVEERERVEYIVVSGSLAPGMTGKIFDRLTALAEKKRARLIVDVPGEALKDAVRSGVYLIKPSIHELLSISNKTGDERMVTDLARDLVSAGKCEVVVVSLGPAGAILVTKDMVRQISPPAVRVRGTVGAGDSLVAGIVWSLHSGKGLEEAVTYGCVCGAAATLHPGTSLCSKEDVDFLLTLK